jgi:hypothetical protein
LAVLFAARRWRYILNAIDHLPRTSHYIAAVAADDELAEQAAGRPAAAPAVPMTEFSPEAERLGVVIDRLGELISLEVAKATRKKPKPVKPYPRPVTASQRAAQRRKYAKFNELRKRLLPDRG